MALVAAALAGIGVLVVGIDMATRPPCPDGYVRLIDLEPVAVGSGVVLALLSLVVYWRARRGTHLKLIVGVGVVLLLFGAFLDLGAFGTLIQHHGALNDDGCWSFG